MSPTMMMSAQDGEAFRFAYQKGELMIKVKTFETVGAPEPAKVIVVPSAEVVDDAEEKLKKIFGSDNSRSLRHRNHQHRLRAEDRRTFAVWLIDRRQLPARGANAAGRRASPCRMNAEPTGRRQSARWLHTTSFRQARKALQEATFDWAVQPLLTD